MVLSDYTNDYKSINLLIYKCIDLVFECRNKLDDYTSSTTYSVIMSLDDFCEDNFIGRFSNLKQDYLSLIMDMTSIMYSFQYNLGKLNSILIKSHILNNQIAKLNAYSGEVVSCLQETLKGIFAKNVSAYNFSQLKDNIDYLYSHCCSIQESQRLLLDVEDALLEPLPEEAESANLVIFEIRSYKNNLDFSSYAQDLSSLSKFMTQIEIILNSSMPIFTRRIESGSLKIVWSGGEIEIKCISDIINAIINGIRSLAFLRTEIKRKELENEKSHLENEALEIKNCSKKLAIINSQIDIIAEKLGLDKNNSQDIEKIQLLCLPLIDYLESNPTGCINDKKYNIDEGIKLLTVSNSDD